ncbi:hypothetical protein [Clostridium sp. M14]|uniref:hypothetical protein n=1 Tax=Clostridium sp. M14 TaxID=2716311 RepID=UPI0013EE6890|nr:hypothetical protein [Clostridium sp. M14]MBZ9693276.1 hypothetical protein [Clostridium sp. M14]
MNNLKNVDILELTKDDGTIEQFREGDKVKIIWSYAFAGSFRKEIHTGIIKYIEREGMELDASKECKSIIINPKYKDIESVERVTD